MRILITGTTGFIGSHIAAALLQEGHEVIGCVRNVERAKSVLPGIELIACDFVRDNDPSVWLPRLKDIDLVINAVGIISEQGSNTFAALHRDTPIALFEACAQAEVKKVIQISALGADEQAKSRYHLTKWDADQYLASLDLDWVILRPSIVYGPGGKSTELFCAMAALPVIPLVGDGKQEIQPIHIDDLTRVVVKLAEQKDPLRMIIEAPGPKAVTFRAMLAEFRQRMGLNKPLFFDIPVPLVRWGILIGGVFNRGLINVEAVEMLLRGNTGNPELLSRVTGIYPRSLEEALEPSRPADRLYARLFVGLPLLRFSVALVWIATGVISAFIYPAAKSYKLLAQTGITGPLAPVILYGAAFLDLALGLAMLANYRVKMVGIVQIVVILVYTAIITLKLPELWLHPFGPVTKNIPLLAAIVMIVLATDERNKRKGK